MLKGRAVFSLAVVSFLFWGATRSWAADDCLIDDIQNMNPMEIVDLVRGDSCYQVDGAVEKNIAKLNKYIASNREEFSGKIGDDKKKEIEEKQKAYYELEAQGEILNKYGDKLVPPYSSKDFQAGLKTCFEQAEAVKNVLKNKDWDSSKLKGPSGLGETSRKDMVPVAEGSKWGIAHWNTPVDGAAVTCEYKTDKDDDLPYRLQTKIEVSTRLGKDGKTREFAGYKLSYNYVRNPNPAYDSKKYPSKLSKLSKNKGDVDTALDGALQRVNAAATHGGRTLDRTQDKFDDVKNHFVDPKEGVFGSNSGKSKDRFIVDLKKEIKSLTDGDESDLAIAETELKEAKDPKAAGEARKRVDTTKAVLKYIAANKDKLDGLEPCDIMIKAVGGHAKLDSKSKAECKNPELAKNTAKKGHGEDDEKDADKKEDGVKDTSPEVEELRKQVAALKQYIDNCITDRQQLSAAYNPMEANSLSMLQQAQSDLVGAISQSKLMAQIHQEFQKLKVPCMNVFNGCSASCGQYKGRDLDMCGLNCEGKANQCVGRAMESEDFDRAIRDLVQNKLNLPEGAEGQEVMKRESAALQKFMQLELQNSIVSPELLNNPNPAIADKARQVMANSKMGAMLASRALEHMNMELKTRQANGIGSFMARRSASTGNNVTVDSGSTRSTTVTTPRPADVAIPAGRNLPSNVKRPRGT